MPRILGRLTATGRPAFGLFGRSGILPANQSNCCIEGNRCPGCELASCLFDQRRDHRFCTIQWDIELIKQQMELRNHIGRCLLALLSKIDKS